ncbi:hypothetical protein PR002_g12349 [Phytophthora rubi]|uniref:Uncharacterized protein n=1 Tax=Phytophthora rubi TaxID=129364 RepID=A0A6A3LP26_9STRA|nr:hypothetical protein PR002_g12349 [Phytophthora rubi]
MSAASQSSGCPGKQSSPPVAPDGGGQDGHPPQRVGTSAETHTSGNMTVVPLAVPTTSPLRSPPPEGISAGQDDSQQVSPQSNVSRTGLLSSDEVVQRVRAGVLPSRDQASSSGQNTLPAHHTLPPPRTLVGDSFIVGVPAHALAFRNGAYVREGYGGMEALMLFDGLSEPDIQDLCSLVGGPAEVREMVLRPYHDQQAPTLDALENTLGSLLARREFASLIMHFSPLELAQRVYYTVSLLHRVLVRDRQRHRIIQDMDANSVARRFLCLQGEHDRLKQDFVFLYEYLQQDLQQEVQSVQNEAASTRCLLEADFARLARENLEETAALRQRVGDLESQLRYAQTQVASLKGQVRESKFDADGLLAFLNGGNNEVRGNWPRFRRLLSQFRRGVSPPSPWETWITVEAADKAFRMKPPYPGPVPPDSDANDDDDAEQEEKREDNPPSPTSTPSLLSNDSGRQSKPKRRSSSGRVQSSEIQHRPTVHPESNVGPRSASSVLPFTVREACALLPEFFVWDDLRLDVQWAMRTGVGYDEAVEMMLADEIQHQLFYRDSLCEMLATMMYRQKLDETRWAKYVSVSYYLMADVLLESWLEKGVVPADWPELHNLTEDLPDILDSSSSEEEDNLEDPDFDALVPDSAEVDTPQVDSTDVTTSPSDSDVLVLRSKRKLKVQRVYSSSDTSENSDTAPSKKLVYTPSPKRPRPSRASDRPSKKSGSLRSKTRSSLDRVRSLLARKSFEDLSPTELAVIEVPGRGILSWRRRGILTQYTPRKGDHEDQTPGFPGYSPQKTEIRYLAQRWTPFEGAYVMLRAKKPWDEMFENRVKVLYFHRRADLSAKVWNLLDEYLEYVRDHAEAFWEVLHWFTIKYKPERDEEDDDLDKYSVSAKLHRERLLGMKAWVVRWELESASTSQKASLPPYSKNPASERTQS